MKRPERPQFVLYALVGVAWLQVAVGLHWRLLTLGLFLLALVLWWLTVSAVKSGSISAGHLKAAVALALLGMVAFPPGTSLDVNSYALYGRMVSEYGINPYTSVPRDVVSDIWYSRTSYFWSDSPSVYGPLFTGVSAVAMELAEGSYLAARLAFQGLAAIALAAATWLLAKRSLTAAALIGLNPLLLTFGVNDAHCDVVVGTLVLTGVLLLRRRSTAAAGLVLALAVLVKFSAAPAVFGAVVWAWFSIGRVAAVRASTVALATLAVGLFVGGGLTSLAALGGAAGRHTRFSVWSPLHGVLQEMGAAWVAGAFVGALATLTVAATGLLLIWRNRRRNAVVAVVAGLVAYQVLGFYTLSWYAAWSLPALALLFDDEEGSSTAPWLPAVAMAHGSLVAIAYLSGWAALVIAALIIAYLVRQRRSGVSLRRWPRPSNLLPR